MKIKIYLCAVLLCCCLSGMAKGGPVNGKPFVIPELKEWVGGNGTLSVSATTHIVYPFGNPDLERIARHLAADCKELLGFRPPVKAGKGEKGDIVLALKADKNLGKEGYTVHIDKDIRLTGTQPVGVYWATRTLLQMAEQNTALPKGDIRDYPDYAIRGFMLDCGRKFIPMSFLHDYVKIMSYYKMNTFQIHLNDNAAAKFFKDDWTRTYAAFRLESDTYPGLAARDGHYTKKEFVDFQLMADSNFVEIIPEIDAPAHTLAFVQYKNELGSKDYGWDHFDLNNPEVIPFMEALLKEYLQGPDPVFRGPKMHIGTDEYSNKDQKIVEKFRAYTDHFIRFVEGYGKQACFWGSLTHAKGTTPVKSENVIMSAWYNGYADPKAMAEQGYKLISIPDATLYIVPAAGYYNDYLNTKYIYENWTPAHVADVVFKEKDPAILGGMFAVWNDHVENGISTKDIHDRAFPAVQTLATKTWGASVPKLPFAEFEVKRKQLSEAPGVNEAGRLSKKPGIVYESAELKPNSKTPYTEVGYSYKVSFDIDCVAEERGTVLFSSPNAVFYLSDPVRGMLGFSRDGYFNTFHYNVEPGKRMNIAIEGNNSVTNLYINGKKVEEMGKETRFYEKTGQVYTFYVRTLVFPLQKTGNFKSRITDFKVYQE